MITIFIIGMVAALVLPRISNRSTEIRATVRKLGILSRDLKSRAKLQNATYRLVINIPTDGDDKSAHEYWVEKSAGEILNNYDPKNPPTLPTDKEDEDDAPTGEPTFTQDTKIFKNPQQLPDGLQFESVELGSIDEEIKSGLVYIHYLPSGFTDEAVIHLKNGEKIRWTIAINSLTGHVDILDEYRKLEDLRAK